VLQTDGNLVVDGPSGATWSTGTTGIRPERLLLATNGDLVLYDTAGRERWTSGTAGRFGARVVMQNDGTLAAYVRCDPIWSSTGGRSRYAAYHPLSLPNLPVTTTQLLVVVGGSVASTDATAYAWQVTAAGRWAQPWPADRARTGYGGWVRAADRRVGDGATAAGTYGLTQAYGLAADPGTAIAYTQVGGGAYRSGDAGDPRTWNMHQPVASATRSWRVSEDTSERYADYPTQYQHLVNIDVYTPPSSTIFHDASHDETVTSQPTGVGKGFALYLHMDGAGDTAGCVSLPSAQLTRAMRWLSPSRHPMIVMGPAAWLATV
jgi:L,D-peptidoglycan transpeptidase YkuD (ErfK/YbiS/YcfS/YnhG family)